MRIEQFLSFADEEKLALVADGEVDAAIVQYLNMIHSRGRPVCDGEVLQAGKARSVVESSEGLEKEGSDKIKTTTAKNDLVRSPLGDGEKQETLMAIHVLMMVVTYCRPGEVLQPMREDLIRPMHGVASDWSLLLHPVQRGVPSTTQSYDDTIDLRKITKVAAVLAAVPPRGSSSTDTKTSPKSFEATKASWLKDIVPYQCRHSGASLDKAGQHRTVLEIKKREKVEVRQQHCPIRKIWKAGADPVQSQQKSTNLFRSHRLSSRGAYLWETPSRDVLRPSLKVAASS